MFAYYGCFLFALNGAAPLSHSGSTMVRWIRRLSLMGTVGRLQLAVTISSRLSPEIPHFLVLWAGRRDYAVCPFHRSHSWRKW